MLLRFGVGNYLSFRDRQELSFAASSLKDRRDGLIACEAVPNGSVVPAAVIYGANASGKTNFVNALWAMRQMILRSHTMGEPGKGILRHAFRLEPDCLKAPSRFDIDFVVEEIRYHYGFEVTDDAVTAEWLYGFPKSYRRTMFERSGDKFDFGRWLRGRNKSIARSTKPNSLFFSAAVQNGHEQLSRLYDFFQSMEFVQSSSVYGSEASLRLAGDGLDRRVTSFLDSMNTGVVGYRKKDEKIPDEFPTIELAHRTEHGEAVYFGLNLESAGTRRLLILLGQAYRALDRGSVLCVDELDASLHICASEAVLKLFCASKENCSGAQLVATTHDTHLMKSASLRRDQFWLAEKTSKGATEIYPLTDIRTRKGDNLELGYLQGRYGALPVDNPIVSRRVPLRSEGREG